MYSNVLLAWRREHRMWIRNVGAPDHAGIRSENRAQTARQPVGFFQVKRQALEPPVARDAEAVRMVILAGVRFVIDNAASRESVVLRISLESGARVSEVLSMTAGGLRQARNTQIGIDVKALVHGKADLSRSKPIWFSEDTRERLFRYIARERSKRDVRGQIRLDQLGDDVPIFLSNRKKQLTCFRRLLRQAQRHFHARHATSSVPWVALPDITPHTIRHLHTTFRVKDIRARFSLKAERDAAFDALVSDWPRATAHQADAPAVHFADPALDIGRAFVLARLEPGVGADQHQILHRGRSSLGMVHLFDERLGRFTTRPGITCGAG
jgi:integrase